MAKVTHNALGQPICTWCGSWQHSRSACDVSITRAPADGFGSNEDLGGQAVIYGAPADWVRREWENKYDTPLLERCPWLAEDWNVERACGVPCCHVCSGKLAERYQKSDFG